jgi:hypothetical protein
MTTEGGPGNQSPPARLVLRHPELVTKLRARDVAEATQALGKVKGNDPMTATTSAINQSPGTPELGFSSAGMQMQKSGIVFSAKLSLHEWEIVGQSLMSFADSASWWIADWLVFGESTFLDRYQEAIKRTSLSYQTLRNYTWVARCFELSRRRDSLSFGHHAEVAALDTPEQDFWLRKAEEFGWSRNRLREEVRRSLHERQIADTDSPAIQVEQRSNQYTNTEGKWEPTDEDSPNPVKDSLYLHFTHDQLAICQAAASSHGLSVDRWATRVLVAAASSGAAEVET